MMSTSRLTRVPTSALPRVVRSSVVGINDTSNQSWPRPGNRQRHTVDGDRTLLDDIPGQRRRQRDPHDLPVFGRCSRDHMRGAVDVPLHDVSAQAAVDRGGALEVDLAAHADAAQARPVQRFAPSRRR